MEMRMASAPRAEDSVAWKGLYTAALFEEDKNKLPALIAHAEGEIVKRARLLFSAPGDNVGEMRALDNALGMLQTLRSCYKVASLEWEPSSAD